MEWYHVWEADYATHKQEHENLEDFELSECLSCEIYHPIIGEVPAVFKKFWDALFKFEDTIRTYNNITIKGLLNLLSTDNKIREDTIHKGKCRSILDQIIESIRYRKQPIMREKGLRIIIIVIVSDCIEGNLENEVYNRLIGNPELMEHRYILEDWDIKNRFQKFFEWCKTILEEGESLSEIGNVSRITENFKQLLYMKKDIINDIEGMEGKIYWILFDIEIKGTDNFDTAEAAWERYMMDEDTGQCKICEQKELMILQDDLEKLGYEISMTEIQKIRNFRVNNAILVTKEFMEKWVQIMNMKNTEIRDKLYVWIGENTTIYRKCEIRWINSKFNDDKSECKDCEIEDEIDERINNLKKICDEVEVEITKGELLRLISMGYTNKEIWDEEFIELFQKNKDELERNLKQILNEYLESIEDEKPENFEEPQEENNEENIINRPDFDSSESSESNSETNSEESDNSLRNLFKTPPKIPPIVPIIMAARNEIREDIRAALLAATGHDVGGNWAGLNLAPPIYNAIEDAGNIAGGTIILPPFYGKENEDVNDWVNQFKIAFTAIGKN
ncbi:hypothetical protein C1646_772786 [Rhizophagus diaphanus]|nr:hypothetical protein C1646_772786 [Rhizophagus diaphanus] [Rhizophagus sp. MUCL 43196]